MAKNKKLLIAAVIIVVILAGLFVYFFSAKKEHFADGGYDDYGLKTVAVPTSPEIEYIEGGPDHEVVNSEGMEMIPPDDIAMSPGYGYGPGTIGFGRAASGIMM